MQHRRSVEQDKVLQSSTTQRWARRALLQAQRCPDYRRSLLQALDEHRRSQDTTTRIHDRR